MVFTVIKPPVLNKYVTLININLSYIIMLLEQEL